MILPHSSCALGSLAARFIATRLYSAGLIRLLTKGALKVL